MDSGLPPFEFFEGLSCEANETGRRVLDLPPKLDAFALNIE